jgi:hypothetical protein
VYAFWTWVELATLLETCAHEYQHDVRKGDLTPEDKKARHAVLMEHLNELCKHGEEKVALTQQIYDMVDRHCKRLDEDLTKLDEEMEVSNGLHVLQERRRKKEYLAGKNMRPIAVPSILDMLV